MKLSLVVGTRPNLVKCAPLWHALRDSSHFSVQLIHTGQHHDRTMSEVFFAELGLPEPSVHLGIGSGSHADQTGRAMIALEPVFAAGCPDLVVVFGDVNSTAAAALVAAKMQIPVAHVEAGLRSFDRSMPEEINRIVTDAVSSLFFTTEPSANENLLREGQDPNKIHFVGNLMVDSLHLFASRVNRSTALNELGLERRQYILVTLHRPSNVDNPGQLNALFEMLNRLSVHMRVVFAVHPRTASRLLAMGKISRIRDGYSSSRPRMLLIDAQPYSDFITLLKHARIVLTDSGGVQEETTALGVPCLTLRPNTERPVTVELGTNEVIGTDPERILARVLALLQNQDPSEGKPLPPLWDGHTAQRIVGILKDCLERCSTLAASGGPK